MIIKSSQRGQGQKLAQHLVNESENERVEIGDSRLLFLKEEKAIHEALSLIELMAAQAPLCKNPFYHVSVNPDCHLSEEQWSQVWQIYEKEYNLEHQAFVEVVHTKKGRSHKHRVYSRVTDEGKVLKMSFNHPRNEKIARRLEYEFAHPLTMGKHNRSVINRLQDEGLSEIVRWMKEQEVDTRSRPVAQSNHDEEQQQKRTKIDIEKVKSDLQWAYQNTKNGWEFWQEIAGLGYMLARGNRRDYVVVDKTGNVHSPRRRLGVKAKELKEKWEDLEAEALLSVDEVKGEQREFFSSFKKCEVAESINFLQRKNAEGEEILCRFLPQFLLKDESEVQVISNCKEKSSEEDFAQETFLLYERLLENEG